MAKIFLTVVGTGDYSPTEYRLGDTVYKKERYVQKALLSMLKDKGEHFDRIVFFLTARAREKNWEQFTAARPNIDGEKETDEGLKPFLEKNFSGIYEALDICEGKNEHELLELFNSMFDAIGENDEITFDITHGFRFIPFLFFPVMSYAKELKNISIKNIYYGLFEKEKVSDIIDLKRYDEILDCASSAHNFRCSGNSSEICNVINRRVKTLPDDEKSILGRYNSIAKCLDDLSKALLTCQGGMQKFSISKKAENLMKNKQRLENLNEKEHRIFNNLISHAITSVSALSTSEPPYELGMKAVEWYISKGLIMQAYTGLRECITTFFCCTYAPNHECDDAKFRQLAVDRAITSSISRDEKAPDKASCLRIAAKLLKDDSLTEAQKKEFASVFVKIITHIDFEKMRFIQRVIEFRNHMNHFGMRKNSNNVNIDHVEKHFSQTKELFKDIYERRNEIISDEEALSKLMPDNNFSGGFINFSNHPSSKWSEKQLEAAYSLCSSSTVTDVQFPDVPADLTEEEIQKIAEHYAEKITAMSPDAVMCMGEFGVSHKVTELLKENEITVVYSCSERIVSEHITESGTEKNSVFNFVRFRKY